MANTSAPLADYFWIAGVDSLSYTDPIPNPITPRDQFNHNTAPAAQVETTIEEGSENDNSPPPTSNPRGTAQHSRNNSWQKLSKPPQDGRSSISNVDELDFTRSNRSSMTIKAGNTNGHGNMNGNGSGDLLGGFDFDTALLKFANERENFLDDLSFSAGAPLQKSQPMTAPPPLNVRTDRLRVDGAEAGNGSGKRSPLRSVGGSIRRRISFRDMNSVKRQPSTVQRASKWNFVHGGNA